MNIDFALLAEQKQTLVEIIHDYTFDNDDREALEGILHLLDALGDEGDPTALDFPVQSDDLLVRFTPEAWVNDYAVEIDSEGPREWHPSVEAEGMVRHAIDSGSDLDFLKNDPFAPDWVQRHRGPFEIELVED
jgi:hypothetical protein